MGDHYSEVLQYDPALRKFQRQLPIRRGEVVFESGPRSDYDELGEKSLQSRQGMDRKVNLADHLRGCCMSCVHAYKTYQLIFGMTGFHVQ